MFSRRQCIFFGQRYVILVSIDQGSLSTYVLQAVESMYLMWKTTGQESWRERGWQMFQAMERNTRTRTAYASVQDVDAHRIRHLDGMPRSVALRSTNHDRCTHVAIASSSLRPSNIYIYYLSTTTPGLLTNTSSIQKPIPSLSSNGPKQSRRCGRNSEGQGHLDYSSNWPLITAM